jgi:hypothetical protein
VLNLLRKRLPLTLAVAVLLGAGARALSIEVLYQYNVHHLIEPSGLRPTLRPRRMVRVLRAGLPEPNSLTRVTL